MIILARHQRSTHVEYVAIESVYNIQEFGGFPCRGAISLLVPAAKCKVECDHHSMHPTQSIKIRA